MKSRGVNFSVGFVIAIIGIAMISMNGAKSLHLNPKGDMLAFTAMISWGFYSAIIKKIGEWDYPTAAVTRRIYFYGMLFLIPVLMWQGVSWDVTVVLSVVILHEKMTFVSVTGALLILLGLIVSQKKINQKK